MAKAKKSSKKNNNTDNKIKELKKLILRHKLVTVLVLILILFVFGFAYNKYKDWENAQFLRGLAQDFPQLVNEIEVATGLELEIKTDCSITTEKFTSGVRTCELIISRSVTDEKTIDTYKQVLGSSPFKIGEKYDNNKGFSYFYKNNSSCGLGVYARGGDLVSFSCITAVREANIDLARELFLNNKL